MNNDKETFISMVLPNQDVLKSIKQCKNESNFDKFKSALIALCKEHDMTITTSGYDGLQVWPLDDGKEPLEHYELEDMTNFANDLSIAAKDGE